MLRRFLPPAPSRVAVEQLRMLLANATFSFTLGGVANVLVAAVFALSAPVEPLAIWALACWLPVPVLHRLARGFAVAPAPTEVVDRYTRRVVAACTATGALRGILPWIAFDHASPLAIALLICFMAAIQAGSMAFMAPVLAAFAGYTLAFLVLLAAKLATMHNPVYWAIAAGAVLFGVAVIASARRLSVAFRSMVELRFENVELVERLRQESALAQAARIEAENANQAKSKFLAAASHDLRQPIHAQGLFLEVLSRGELSSQQRDVLANARAACVASGDMLNTLLDFSRLEAGVVAVNVRPFRLQPLLNRIENELAPLADRKDIVYRLRETEAVIDSDAALVELILRNLVSNAIRYTERGGVLIGCRRRGDALRIEVWDTGIGIAPEHHTEVFREFHQLGNPERDRRKGLGLGLAIAERLAHALGSTLSLQSQPRRGSVFAITLPLASACTDAAASVPLEDANSGMAQLRVLVVDDDEAVRNGMLQLMRSWGADCEASESIEQALANAARAAPQLVICDYRLRDQRTGTEAIAALRRLHPALPAILITGDTAPERLREAQASGLPLLHKPVAPADLWSKIAEVVADRQPVQMD
ncbi:ATP-binding response regulator [Dyella mobilis]|uniref:histidine kinase n=1 Tax=Dyella mobilis TaxID=1849582 RepID=A0ABS2KGQ9_9GAMM|nr:hybrid sensor histidine kinase/response regulator [Dyella mobilis]MBM7129942.1 response regulator [Dyella mobilis]